MTGFVFFSIRTSGPDLLTDHVVEVSAIRTDHDFAELARVEFQSIPPFSTLTSPEVPFEDPTFVASHFEMMRQVAQTFARWSPAVFVGCDAMQANDRFLRRALYLTLHDPFVTTSFGSGRTDVIRMTEMAAVHAPGSIVIPRQGRSSIYELIAIARANGIEVGRNETAMSDVEASLAICRLIADRAPEVASSCARFSQPASVRHFIEENVIVLLTRRVGSQIYTRHVTSLADDLPDDRECLVFDLSVDPEEFAALDVDALGQRMNALPKLVTSIRVNACPILSEFDETMPVLGMETDDLMRRAGFLLSNPDLKARLVKGFSSVSERLPSPAVLTEAAFEPFVNRHDRALASAFHQADSAGRSEIAQQFLNDRLNAIAARLLNHDA